MSKLKGVLSFIWFLLVNQLWIMISHLLLC